MAVLAITRIPESHPKREAVEDAIREVLGAVPGDWFVRVSPTSGSWTIAVRRVSDGFRRMVVLSAAQQTPDGVAAELAMAVRDAA